MFAVLVVVTGIELATGRSLDGQQGTTVGHVTGSDRPGTARVPGRRRRVRPRRVESTDAGTTSPTDSPTSPETGVHRLADVTDDDGLADQRSPDDRFADDRSDPGWRLRHEH